MLLQYKTKIKQNGAFSDIYHIFITHEHKYKTNFAHYVFIGNFGANNEIKPETRDFSLEDQNFTTKSCSQRKFLPLFIIIINDNDNSNMHIEDNDGALVY